MQSNQEEIFFAVCHHSYHSFLQKYRSDLQSQIFFLTIKHNPAARTKIRRVYLGLPVYHEPLSLKFPTNTSHALCLLHASPVILSSPQLV
jgi:hypothetical protein